MGFSEIQEQWEHKKGPRSNSLGPFLEDSLTESTALLLLPLQAQVFPIGFSSAGWFFLVIHASLLWLLTRTSAPRFSRFPVLVLAAAPGDEEGQDARCSQEQR